MSKRRINKQQTARIEKIQAKFRQASTATAQGLVLTRYSRHAEIEDSQGMRIHCSIRANLDSLVAGDQVIWQAEGDNQGVIVSRFPRKTVLERPDKRGIFRPIAANITQIIVVVAAKPELTWPLLDSYLVVAEHLALPLIIVMNKSDLPCQPIYQELSDQYAPLGYQLISTSIIKNQGIDQLKAALNNQTSIFVGQSGVGKSTLVSTILPHENNIQTAALSERSELGSHTTSNSSYYHLPSGGALIDSPGVRDFGLWHMALADIALGYREFKPYIAQCKFRNCIHQDSPGCAITHAVQEGKITKRRYDNFIKLVMQFAKNSY